MRNFNFSDNVLQIGNYKIYKKSLINTDNLGIIDVGNKYGCMNTMKTCYPEEMSNEERRLAFLEHRKLVSAAYDYEFNPYKFYMPTQNGEGKAVELTREMVEAYDDGWKLDIPGDILVVTDKTPGVVAGFPVADCVEIIASDLKQGITATAHCNNKKLNEKLPQRTVEALQSMYNSKLENISIYIGAHAGDSYTYNNWPDWATEEFWKETGAIKEEEKDLFRINHDLALLYMLDPEKFATFIINATDTITSSNHYSNHAYNHGKGPKEKEGRNFVGAYYKKRRI